MVPGRTALNVADPYDTDAQPWLEVVEAPTARDAEVVARYLHTHDIAFDVVSACGLALDSVVVDTSGTLRPVITLRRIYRQVDVRFHTDDLPLDAECPDCTYPLDAGVLVLPAGAPIPQCC